MKTPSKVARPPLVFAVTVTPPYRAEHRKTHWVGPWRPDINDAMQDGRSKGVGARIYSSERVLLAKFDNAYAKETAESKQRDKEEADEMR